jgi:hypothetical protein
MTRPVWDFGQVCQRMADTLRDREEALRLEQAVYGMDAMDELQIVALLADGLAASYSVAREVHYPSTVGRKLTHRPRCDLVLTEPGRPLRLDTSPPTLFDPANPAPPDEALWVEVKIAFQYGSGGARHKGYGRQWTSAVVADLVKIEQEPMIRDAALALVVFNESQTILDKDLELFETLLAEKQVLAGFRRVRTIPILERIGHRLCSVALWPTIQR